MAFTSSKLPTQRLMDSSVANDVPEIKVKTVFNG